MKNIALDNEEKELLQSLETEEWVSVDNLEKEIKKHQRIVFMIYYQITMISYLITAILKCPL